MFVSRTELKPVFIVGTPRSGTTLLYRTLLKHPSFKLPQLCLEETKIFMKPEISLISKQKPASLFNYMLQDDERYQEFLNSIKPEYTWQKIFFKTGFDRFFSEKPAFWFFLLNKRIVRKFFFYAKQARGCNRIVEKTPRHILKFNRIQSTFPNSKIIVTLRHPVDVFSSYKKRKQRDPDSNWLSISITDFIKRYRKMSTYVLELSDSENAICVKYEDFVKNPEKEFRQICNHINEPFISDLLYEGEKSLNDYKIDPLLSKPISPRAENWSDYLNGDQVSLIENNLQHEMEKFGYTSRLIDV
ncbi:MAG: sulfotransferase [Balneolaceae bacterium]|nr:MAG: sulfotransferase [Balneolaceae bacterium]